jgi:hypothetical protein
MHYVESSIAVLEFNGEVSLFFLSVYAARKSFVIDSRRIYDLNPKPNKSSKPTLIDSQGKLLGPT